MDEDFLNDALRNKIAETLYTAVTDYNIDKRCMNAPLIAQMLV